MMRFLTNPLLKLITIGFYRKCTALFGATILERQKKKQPSCYQVSTWPKRTRTGDYVAINKQSTQVPNTLIFQVNSAMHNWGVRSGAEDCSIRRINNHLANPQGS